jgi:hypothetical protein
VFSFFSFLLVFRSWNRILRGRSPSSHRGVVRSAEISTASPPTTMSAPQCPIILLKTKLHPTDPYHDKFSAQTFPCFDPIFVPVLQHKPINLDRLTQLIASHNISSTNAAAEYSGLIITSQRAVEAISVVLAKLSGPPHQEGNPSSSQAHSTPRPWVVPVNHRSLRSRARHQLCGCRPRVRRQQRTGRSLRQWRRSGYLHPRQPRAAASAVAVPEQRQA